MNGLSTVFRGERHTNFISHSLVGQGTSRRLTEQNDPPLPLLRKFEALVVDLMRKLTSRGKNECADT